MKKAIIHYIGYLLSAVGAVVGVSLLSYYVTPADYGRVALYISLGTLFQYIVRESLGAAILRYTEQINQQKSVCLYLVSQSFKKLGFIFILVLGFAFVYLDNASLAEFSVGMLAMFLFAISTVGETFLSTTGNRLACAIHVNLLQWLRFLLAFLLFVFWQQSVLAIMAGFLLGFLAAVLYDVYVFMRQDAGAESLPQVVPVLPANVFSGYTAIAIGFLVWFLTFYERIALEWFHGETYLGAYFVLFQIGFMPVYLVMQSAVSYFYPLLFAKGEADTRYVKTRYFLMIIVAIFLAFLILELIHGWLFGWLVGPEYREYSWLLPWLFLVALLNAVSYMLQAYYYEKDLIRKLLHIKLVAALAAFVLITFFVWQAGIQGLVFAGVLVSLLLIVLSYRYIDRD